jgi:transcriptional regulator with XRE-family HTH domain
MKKPKAKTKKEKTKEEVLAKIAERIRELRKKKGYTSAEFFAYDHDLSRSQYGKYEQGVDDMRITSLIKVINALGVTPQEFFKGLD